MPPTLLLAGASGALGQAIAARLPTTALLRDQGPGPGPRWSTESGLIDGVPEPVAAVICAAGAPLLSAAGVPSVAPSLRAHRQLADWIAARGRRPSVFISLSSARRFGEQGEALLDEDSPGGADPVAQAWAEQEAAAAAVEAVGVRAVILRLGLVMHPGLGLLQRLGPAVRHGLLGPWGGGRQWLPWVGLNDVLRVIELALHHEELRGVLHLVAPGQLRQAQWAAGMRAAAGHPRRPGLPLPAAALRRALAPADVDGLLLQSRRLRPTALLDLGYSFAQPELVAAMAPLLHRG